MHALADRLRQLRKAAQMTVREFAERIHKSPGYVSRTETRGEIPTPELLCTIAHVYGVAPEELLVLAKQCRLERSERHIEARSSAALAVYRKENR